MKGYVCAHGERLIEGTLAIEKKIAHEVLPRSIGLPIFQIRHFPSIVRGAPPSVLQWPKPRLPPMIHFAQNLTCGEVVPISGPRLEGDTDFSSGTSVFYKNGGAQVSYDKIPGIA